jgi:hypothetical protein
MDDIVGDLQKRLAEEKADQQRDWQERNKARSWVKDTKGAWKQIQAPKLDVQSPLVEKKK